MLVLYKIQIGGKEELIGTVPSQPMEAGYGSGTIDKVIDRIDSVGAGNFKDQIAVFILGPADEQTAMIEQLNLGLKNGALIFHHLQSDVSPFATNFMGGDLQAAVAGQRYRARLAGFQVEAFAAEQTVGGIIEHGLQFADISFQLPIDAGAIA